MLNAIRITREKTRPHAERWSMANRSLQLGNCQNRNLTLHSVQFEFYSFAFAACISKVASICQAMRSSPHDAALHSKQRLYFNWPDFGFFACVKTVLLPCMPLCSCVHFAVKPICQFFHVNFACNHDRALVEPAANCNY